MHLHTVLTTVLLVSAPFAAGWGSLGHRTVAYLSSLYLTDDANRFTNHLLNGQDISEAALYPDKVAHIPGFEYSRPWHYIDAKDNPPHECKINMTRDCAVSTGCVVSAIANHTNRVMDEDLPRFFRGQSLRFVLHFIGDIHQPLHTEYQSRGGNGIEVKFDGKQTNLHSVWDTLVPNKYRHREDWGKGGRESEEEAAFLWAQELYAADANNSTLDNECTNDAADCALEWADESNQWVCNYVLKHGVDGVQDFDLAGEYYDGATNVIDSMILKGGRRLAAWVNMMADEAEQRRQEMVVQELK